MEKRDELHQTLRSQVYDRMINIPSTMIPVEPIYK